MRLNLRLVVGRMFSLTALLALTLVVSACQGVKPGKTPWKEFVVNVPVKTAYERALEQAKFCLVTQDRMPLSSRLATDGKSAFVRVTMRMTETLLADVKIRAFEGNKSIVLVEMWGVDVWNTTAIDAMQAAIEFGVPSCVNYFPTQTFETNPKKR